MSLELCFDQLLPFLLFNLTIYGRLGGPSTAFPYVITGKLVLFFTNGKLGDTIFQYCPVWNQKLALPTKDFR